MNDKLTRLMAQGRARFVVRYGVLGWGLGTAALFTAWTCFANDRVGLLEVLLPFLLFPLGGVFWGLLTWSALKTKHAATGASETE